MLGAFSTRLDKTPTLPATPYDYDGIALPAHLEAIAVSIEDNTPDDNPVTDAGATLGRVLFYDVRLSQNETVSCGSCHLQDRGFSDPVSFSLGFEGNETARNSMGLAFARFYRSGRFFWDERAETLEHQTLLPIQDPIEMGMTLPEVQARLAATDFYPDLFEDAFGTPDITSDRMSRALSQFIRSIVAPNSRYDQARAAEPSTPLGQALDGLSAQENHGLQLFFGPGRCTLCHRTDLFVGDEPRNNGLDAEVTDEGAGGGRFKTNSLRNIALTAPYMHDGRFATLGDVIDHYSTGVQDNPNLDIRLRGAGGQPIRRNFSPQERAALIAFLETLTDETLATDPRWSDPFSITGTTAAPDPGINTSFELVGPNPTRGTTAFRLRLDTSTEIQLEVFSATGRRVATLLDGVQSGEVSVQWDTDGLAAGSYVVRLRNGASVVTKTVTVVR